MDRLLLVVTLVICSGLSASAGHPLRANRCLPSFGKYPFDEQKFSGDWYAVANVFRPNKYPGGMTCDKIHYSAETVGNVTRTHVDVHFKLADGTVKSLEGKGQALKPGLASAATMSFKFSTDKEWRSIMRHSILATDYETYALVHGCKEFYDEKTDMFGKFVIDQIWSRSRTLDEGVLKTLKSVMSGLDIADEDWSVVDNSDC